MSIDTVLNSSSFKLKENIYYQKNILADKVFEVAYLTVRKKENRLYSDKLTAMLPDVPPHHQLLNEWKIRRETCQKLINYLRTQNKSHQILEIGCGNGWLSNRLTKVPATVYGLDINEFELLQGARVFGTNKELALIYGDIFSIPLPLDFFDVIILPSCIQYFSDVSLLISRLFKILNRKGEIHIIDSPVYTSQEIDGARMRTASYYSHLGFAEMTKHYFHHHWDELKPFDFKLLHNPTSIHSKLKRLLQMQSMPFPWIVINNEA